MNNSKWLVLFVLALLITSSCKRTNHHDQTIPQRYWGEGSMWKNGEYTEFNVISGLDKSNLGVVIMTYDSIGIRDFILSFTIPFEMLKPQMIMIEAGITAPNATARNIRGGAVTGGKRWDIIDSIHPKSYLDILSYKERNGSLEAEFELFMEREGDLGMEYLELSNGYFKTPREYPGPDR